MTATLTQTRSPRPPDHSGASLAVTTALPGVAGAPDPTASHGGGRGGGRGGAMRVDPRDRAQLAETPVPLPRVLALFRPHRLRVAVVVAIIVVTVVVALAPPFLVRDVIDDALPQQDVALLLPRRRRDGRRRGRDPAARRRADLALDRGRAAGHARLRTDVFAHLQRQSIGFFTRTRSGEVQSRLTNDIGGMQAVVTSTATSIASNLTTVVATAVAMVALSLAAVAALAGRPPAGHLADPRVARMRREITAAAAAPPGRPERTRSRRACRSAACSSPRPSAPAAHGRSGSPTPRHDSSTSSCARSWPAAGGWPR